MSKNFLELQEQLQQLSRSLADAYSRDMATKEHHIRLLEKKLASWAPPSPIARMDTSEFVSLPSGANLGKPVVARASTVSAVSMPGTGVEVMASPKKASRCTECFSLRDQWDIGDVEFHQLLDRARGSVMSTTSSPMAGLRGTLKRSSSYSYQDDDEMGEQGPPRDWFVIHPESPYRIAWNFVAFLLLTYGIVMIPVAVFDPEPTLMLILIDWLALLYWTFDMMVSFATGYYDNLEVELRFAMAWRKYVKTWFVFDVVVLIIEWATQILEALADGQTNEAAEGAAGLSRSIRAARAIRVVRYLRLIRLVRLLKLQGVMEDWRDRTNNEIVLLAFMICKVIFFVSYLAHAGACIWYAVGDVPEGWVRKMGIQNNGAMSRYWMSIQWAMTKLHPSNTRYLLDELHTNGERIFSVLSTLCALAISALFVSLVTSQMTQMKARSKARSSKLEVVRLLASQHGLTNRLVMRLKHYITITYMQQLRGNNEAHLLKILPQNLLIDLHYESWSPILSPHMFFNTMHERHRRTEAAICNRAAREVVAYRDDTVFNCKDKADLLYIVTQGTLQYCRPGLQDPFSVVIGDKLCEQALWLVWSHRGTLIAMNTTAKFVGVNSTDLEEVVREHSGAYYDSVLYARAFLERLKVDYSLHTDINTNIDVRQHRRSHPGRLSNLLKRGSSSVEAQASRGELHAFRGLPKGAATYSISKSVSFSKDQSPMGRLSNALSWPSERSNSDKGQRETRVTFVKDQDDSPASRAIEEEAEEGVVSHQLRQAAAVSLEQEVSENYDRKVHHGIIGMPTATIVPLPMRAGPPGPPTGRQASILCEDVE